MSIKLESLLGNDLVSAITRDLGQDSGLRDDGTWLNTRDQTIPNTIEICTGLGTYSPYAAINILSSQTTVLAISSLYHAVKCKI